VTTARATLPARLRLKTQREFQTVYRHGRRASGDWMTVVALVPREPRRDSAGPRLGLSVSKDHGGAVRRNKIKRLLREAFRLERHRLPATVEVVLIPRQRDEDFPLADLRNELVRLVERALRSPQPRRPKEPR
jgi:ribonuclease P protein component